MYYLKKYKSILMGLSILLVTQVSLANTTTIPYWHIDSPISILTPGDIATKDIDKICTIGYSSTVRDVSAGTKRKVYKLYNIPLDQQGTRNKIMISKIDHLVPLEIGGSNSVKNLWPHFYQVRSGYNVYYKSHLENYMRKSICNKKISVDEAQTCFMTDWIKCYQKHIEGKKIPIRIDR